VLLSRHFHPSYSFPVLRASGKREEDGKDAAKKKAIDLESAKQHRIQRNQIVEESVRELNQFQRVVNKIPHKYLPLKHWNHFPDIWILGFPKAGTSQLYQLLTHHPALQAFHRTKEFCMDNNMWLDYSQPNEKLYASLYSYHEFMNSNMSKPVSTRKKLTVNACLNSKETLLNYMYIQKHYLNASSDLGEMKFIITFRDPADLLYSMFNFFTNPSVDVIGRRPVQTWSYELLDYRSPELFHELLVSGNKTLYGKLQRFFLNGWFVSVVSWMHLVGRENLLVIKNEDMIPEEVNRQGGVLDQLSSFLGVDRDLFDPEIFNSKTNCNDGNILSRGMGTKCIDDVKKQNKEQPPSSSITYPISANRAMLPKTRKLIYVMASEGCQLLSQYFSHVLYEKCVQSVIMN
jgi:hypothetical protein